MIQLAKSWYWLSFCNREGQFLGAMVVQGFDFVDAVRESHRLGLNPGGEVVGGVLESCKLENRNRLFNKEEASRLAKGGVQLLDFAAMQYLVSIENRLFHHWQVELLIESFRLLGQEDNLVIAIAESKGGSYEEYVKRFSKHPHKFQHKNYGKSLNKIYGIITALKHGLIKQPFVLVHPDMVMVKPVEDNKIGKNNVLYHAHHIQEDNVNQLLREAITFRNPEDPKWHNYNGVMIFNEVADDFFVNTISFIESLVNRFEQPWAIYKAAMNFSSYRMPQVKSKGDFLECSLTDDNLDGYFVHYNHGNAPFFHKNQFFYNENISMGADVSPYKSILQITPTRVTQHVHKVVNSLLT